MQDRQQLKAGRGRAGQGGALPYLSSVHVLSLLPTFAQPFVGLVGEMLQI